MEKKESFRQPKMTIAEMNIITEKCKILGLDPEPYMSVQYAGKLIFDLTRLEIEGNREFQIPDAADYKVGGKYDYAQK